MPTMVGGTSEAQDPDDNIKQICEEIREELERKSGRQFEEFTPLKYKSQLVNGINYFIKVRGGAEQHLHVRVHKSFQGQLTISSFLLDKGVDDELQYFQ